MNRQNLYASTFRCNSEDCLIAFQNGFSSPGPRQERYAVRNSHESRTLLIPAGQFREVAGEVIGSGDQVYYRSLNDDELIDSLRRAAGELHAASVRISEEVRRLLLPGLIELRERYMQPGRRTKNPDRPTYYEVLRSMNLKPDTVRKWFKRTAAADVMLELLGQPWGRPAPDVTIQLPQSCLRPPTGWLPNS
jgi:hypothetical protein